MAYATTTYMAIAAITAAVASASATAYSSDQSRRAANQTADYNAEVAEQNAWAERDKAAIDEKAHRESIRRILATQRALYGKGNMSMEGSPLLVQEDTNLQGELDAMAIRYGGDVLQSRYKSQATMERANAGFTARAAKAGYVQAGSTLLSGAASAYGSYSGGGKTMSNLRAKKF